jgi:hypothetical protein
MQHGSSRCYGRHTAESQRAADCCEHPLEFSQHGRIARRRCLTSPYARLPRVADTSARTPPNSKMSCLPKSVQISAAVAAFYALSSVFLSMVRGWWAGAAAISAQARLTIRRAQLPEPCPALQWNGHGPQA